MKHFLLCSAVALCPAAVIAQEAATPWTPSARSSARFVASGPLEGATYSAGVEIHLNPKTITYWRNPGDAGVPPLLSVEGSDNLAKAVLLFPAPRRIAEAGGVEAFGYDGDVLLPMSITPLDAAKPVRLVLNFAYAACEKICVPASAEGELVLAPAAAATSHAGTIAAAVRALPKALAENEAVALLSIKPAGGGEKPQWSLAFPTEAGISDVFAEGAEGFSFETGPATATGGFMLVLTGHPKDAALPGIALRLTAVGSKGAFEISTHLDAGPAKP